MRQWFSKVYQVVCWALWGAALLALPITSFPWLSDRLGGTSVAAPSAFLFLILALVWLLPFVLRGGQLPRESAPLLIFLSAALISWAAAFFANVPTFRGRGPLSEGLEICATVSLGMASFFVPAVWVMKGGKRLLWTVRFINLGGIALLAWSLVQAGVVIFKDGDYPQALIEFQWLFSMRSGGPLFANRLTGFAYEPSWLGHQLNLIYLPIWFAATVLRWSAYRWRCLGITLENILFLVGGGVLFLSVSRLGWASFLLVLTCASLLGLARWVDTLWKRMRPQSGRTSRVILAVCVVLASLVIYPCVGWGLLQVGARFETRLARIMSRNILEANNLYEVFNNLEFAERVMYWDAGLRTYADHWFLGTGLGNSGFYFSQNVYSFGLMLPEVANLLNRFDYIPNTKSLWVRVLTETGLLGFAFFLAWYYALGMAGITAWRSREGMLQSIGLAGLFALLAFLLEGFSMDSFALPYFWLEAGLLAGVGAAARRLSTIDVQASPSSSAQFVDG